MKTLLHVGCGYAQREQVGLRDYLGEDWQHIRVDIDPDVKPDVIDDIRKLSQFADNSADGIYSSHNLEHLHPNDALDALKSFLRVLRPGGSMFALVPDIQIACQWVAEGKGLETIYNSPMGPITPIDMIYGHRGLTYANQYQIHRCGYTVDSMRWLVNEAGFTQMRVLKGQGFDIWAYGEKHKETM